jgi:hypothetical protein
MFSAHNKKQTTLNFRKNINKPAAGNNCGIFKEISRYKIFKMSKR